MTSTRIRAQASGLVFGRRLRGIAGLVAVIALSSGCVASSSSQDPASGAVPATPTVESSTPDPSTPPTTGQEDDPSSSDLEDSTDRDLTRSQSEAIESARSYLDFSAFSRSGLIDQLEFEGFSNDDATFAVDSLNVDWNEQAAKSAESYLEYSSFSRSGLIDQLIFEGVTQSQAEYGVSRTGL